MKKLGRKVFVGLSGGVDSSVSLALLKKTGYDVTGVFIKAWHPDWLECDWKSDRRDAMRVCARLDVPFLTLDLEKEYKNEVVDYMISEYKKGRTPNPDVMCNKEIKFGEFLKFARKNGADYVATGHYAQNKFSSGKFKLSVSKDTEKDQSYFLWTLTQNQLQHILFPVGHLTKPQVRALATKLKLPTAEKKDSQGLCFIGRVDMKDFLSRYVKSKKGIVLDVSGKKIGTHDGAVFVTIGQRHGFTVKNKNTKSEPFYVVAKDIKKNTITVSTLSKKKGVEGNTKSELSEVNWINKIPQKNKVYTARLRYRQTLFPVTLEKKKNWVVSFKTTQNIIPPGQSLVVYDKEMCCGGGIIEKSF